MLNARLSHIAIAVIAVAILAGAAVIHAQGNPGGSLGCQSEFIDCGGVCTLPAECTSGQGGTDGQGGTSGPGGTGGQQNPTAYLSSLYMWFLGFVGIAALFAIVYGGVLWMFSTSLTSTGEARKWIQNAIFGLVLAGASWLLLNTINPDLVQGFDLQGIIDRAVQSTGAGGGPSSTAPSQPPVTGTGPGTCPGCVSVSSAVPLKPGACAASVCQIAPPLNDKLTQLAQGIAADGKSADYWRVTEAWPPTVQHQNPCHQQATCVDANLNGSMVGQPSEITYFITKAQSTGLLPVYEVTTETRRNQLVSAGVPASSIQIVPQITGEHFSLYNA